MKDRDAIAKVRVYLRNEGIILPKKPIKEFYSQIFKLSGFGIGGILSFSGKKAGAIGAQIIRSMAEDESELKSLEIVFSYVKVFLEEASICKLESWEIKDGEINFSVSESIFAEAVGKSKKPVCIPLSGAIGGFLEELTGTKWECKEIKCRSQGEEMCEFQVKISK